MLTNETERRFSTILMDVDGTLLDFDEAERRGICKILQYWHIEPTKSLLSRYHEINLGYWKQFETGSIPKEAIFENRFPHFLHELGVRASAQEMEDMYRSSLDACAALIPDALEVCAYLERHYQLYVVTNGVSSTQYRRLRTSTLDRFFSQIFVSEDAGSQKPQLAFFDYCFARIPEQDRSKVLIIGDSLSSDILGGKKAGISTCWFCQDENARLLEDDPKPDFRIQKLADLTRLL